MFAKRLERFGDNDPAIADAFRLAMRGVAATVNIITAVGQDSEWKGMTGTAMTSVSMEPPTCAICVNASASVCPAILGSGMFCVNVLSADDAELAGLFANSARRELRFATASWSTDPHGLPYVASAQAVISCRVVRQLEVGTHHLLVGEVLHSAVARAAKPLVYCDGRYAIPELL